MANELKASSLVSGSTYFVTLRNAAGQYYSTALSGFENKNDLNWANYRVAPVAANSVGDWTGSVPSGLAAGNYSVTGRLLVSGFVNGVQTDSTVGQSATLVWSGTQEITAGADTPGTTTLLAGVNVTKVNGNHANPFAMPIPVTVANQSNAATTINAIGTSNSTTFTNATISGNLNYPFGWSWAYSGMDLTNWTQVLFTAKTSPSSADSAASITVKLSAPGAGDDGLTILNGAPISAPTLASDGAITVAVTPASGTTPVQSVVTLNLTARGMALAAEQSLFWETTWLLAGVKQPMLDGGTFNVAPSVRANAGAS